MKIENNINVDGLTPAQKQPNVEETASDKVSAETDRSSEKHLFSELAHRLSEAKGVLDNLPDVRVDRIAQVKAKLLKGYYDAPEVKEALISKLTSILKETGSKT